MALTETLLLDSIRVARETDYFQSAAVRSQLNGVTQALYEDRALLTVDGRNILADKLSKEQAVKVDVITDLPSGTGSDYTCSAEEEVGDKRIAISTQAIQKGFVIKRDGDSYTNGTDVDNTTNGYANILNKSMTSVLKRLHEGMELVLESAIDAITDYPNTTYPYASAGGAVTIPLADWKVSASNPAPSFLGAISTLLAQQNYSPTYRLIGNASFKYALSQAFAQGPQNAFNNQWQFMEFMANFSTVDGAFLNGTGVNAFAFQRGEHSFDTWAHKTMIGSDGASERWFFIEDPAYPGIFWDVYYLLDCSNGRPVETWSFANYLAHTYAPSRLAEGNGVAEPGTLELTLATS